MLATLSARSNDMTYVLRTVVNMGDYIAYLSVLVRIVILKNKSINLIWNIFLTLELFMMYMLSTIKLIFVTDRYFNRDDIKEFLIK